MKLFVLAALVAAASAARLEHLERSYLPPDHHVHSGNGFGSGNNRFGVSGQSSNGFESNGGADVFGSNGQGSFGIGSNGHSPSLGSNGFGALQGSHSNGLSRNSAFESASKQYLPPVQGQSGSESEPNSFGNLGSSISPACVSCGAYNQYNQGVQSQVPSSNYGVPQLGSQLGSQQGSPSGSPSVDSNSFEPQPGSQGFGSPLGSQLGSRSGSSSVDSNSFEPQPGSLGFGSQPQFGAANRQYLAPKYSSQNPPQQPFDEKTGYIY